jgi:eukaryotic-like serine/threonine-protein kinase
MSDLRPRLEAALAGSFHIERELGQGGMAVVYLARDLRHGRPVALKVFLPEIATALGHERFLREIRTAANLSHPNILTLFDSGEADGLLWYVMPYVEGEALAQRIQRDGPLPIDEALNITRQVAMALQYAHSRGVVHRDIKPGNILLSGGTAYVADFGIAHALEETGEKLTSTGIAIGTPAYMSPEQSGSGKLDGRADIYSLGCVLYEMLVGEPPFVGRSAQVILARHSVERVPSARAVRDTIPPVVEVAIHKAMAKTPADRFASAEDFASALAPERLTAEVPAAPLRLSLPRRWIFALGGFAGLALVVLVALRPWRSSPPRTVVDPNTVAVLPFQASNPADSGVARQLAPLFIQHLDGNGGPRAVPDSTTAGLRLSGNFATIEDRLVLSATLRTAAGKTVWSRQKLSAPRDSVLPLVSRAVLSLLAGMTGEPEDHLVALEKLPESYLRNYLTARRAYFRGDYQEAVHQYEQVLAADSTCFPAALGLATAANHASSDSAQRRDLALVLALRSRLQSHDLPYLAALDTVQAPVFERIKVLNAWNEAVSAAPDRPELWYELGERLFHDGPWTGYPDVLDRAKAAFRSALTLEPSFVPALRHLIDLAASQDSVDEVKELGPRYLALDSIGDLADYYRWRIAVALNDGGNLKKLRQRFDSLPEATLERMINVSQLDGVGLEDGIRAAEVLWARAGELHASRWRYTKRREIALNRGRPAEARAITQRRMAMEQPLRPRDHLSEVIDALYWDADTTLASQLMTQLADSADRHTRGIAADPSDPMYYDICALGFWRISRGISATVAPLIADLRRAQRPFEQAPGGSGIQGSYLGVCADVLEAQLAAATRAPDLRARVAQLDSTVRRREAVTWVLAAANLTSARIWEQLGDRERALTAVRRRVYITDLKEQRVLVALTTFLREEGRLAALTGDKAGAIQAYRIYLAIRANPEPALAPLVARVRAALDSLQR